MLQIILSLKLGDYLPVKADKRWVDTYENKNSVCQKISVVKTPHFYQKLSQVASDGIALPVNVGRYASFCKCSIINPTFIAFQETSSYWPVEVFSVFHWSPPIGKPRMTPVPSPSYGIIRRFVGHHHSVNLV